MSQATTLTQDFAPDLALALRLADLADAISMDRYRSLDLVIETKPDATPVTDADKATELALRELLAQERPADLIVGEEFGTAALTTNKRYWVLDPIDGTKNYLRGVPTWATLIGLANPDGEIVVGVVSCPALFRRWYASKGMGAFLILNGGTPEKISVSAVANLAEAAISYSDLEGWRTRGLGDFWSHMLVAEGAIDLGVEPSLALWDMAALDIIVREAGGSFTNIDGVSGPHGGSAISSNGLIHQAFIDAISTGS
jgi:histidinol-phosphatase